MDTTKYTKNKWALLRTHKRRGTKEWYVGTTTANQWSQHRAYFFTIRRTARELAKQYRDAHLNNFTFSVVRVGYEHA